MADKPTAPIEKRGGYTPSQAIQPPTQPPPKPGDAGPSAKPPVNPNGTTPRRP